MKRTYICTAELFKGAKLSIEATVKIGKEDRIKDIENKVKEAVADEFTTDKRKFSAADIKLKIKK